MKPGSGGPVSGQDRSDGQGPRPAGSTPPVGPGTILGGRYRLDELVGRGGMATVYRAWDATLERVVAVKLLHDPYRAEPGFLDRFRREARAAARLSHPRVVGVFDYADDPTGPFIVMEYVPGPTLKDELARRGPWTPADVAAVGAQVCEALAAAHAAGVVHRDVTARNIIVERDRPPSVKVADFGIARLADGGDQTVGLAVGSVHYIAPEQARGEAATPASDLYGLGVVLFELLSGQVPFTGASLPAILVRHTTEQAPWLCTINPAIPAELAAIVDRALAKDPLQRFPDARTMGAALAALAATEVEAGASLQGGSADPAPGALAAPSVMLSRSEASPRGSADPAPSQMAATVVGLPPANGALDDAPTMAMLETTVVGRSPAADPAQAVAVRAPTTAGQPRRRSRRLVPAILLAAGMATAGFLSAEYMAARPGSGSPPAATTITAAPSPTYGAGSIGGLPRPAAPTPTPVSAAAPPPTAIPSPTATPVPTAAPGPSPVPARTGIRVPSLLGLKEEQARRTLEANNLRLGKATEQAAGGVPEGIVVAQQPQPGADLPRGSRVDVALSKDPGSEGKRKRDRD
ncbi:MAG: protein kinase [Chloroflexi bacterium]|nr:protein kinase [Chloroflexota bacterium]